MLAGNAGAALSSSGCLHSWEPGLRDRREERGTSPISYLGFMSLRLLLHPDLARVPSPSLPKYRHFLLRYQAQAFTFTFACDL